MLRRGFTLIELLVVIAIIAILAAVLFPVFAAVRAAAWQSSATGTEKEINESLLMYIGDNDDVYMPAMYISPSGYQAWFGHKVPGGYFDRTTGMLFPYEKSTKLKDPTADFKDYNGDHSGFGYNWGFLGSDFHVTRNYSTFPNCKNMAMASQLSKPSGTVVFATSVYYSVPWLNGDGLNYDFGFIDPISYRPGNPNVDFRHIVPKVVDRVAHTIGYPGNAVIVLADGHARTIKIGDLADSMFYR